MINCKKALTEGYLVSALVLVAVLMRCSGGVAGMSTPVSDDDVCHSVRCAYHAVEDAIGEPQALMVVVDETAMRGTAVEASTDAGAVCHMVYHDRAVVFNQAHLAANRLSLQFVRPTPLFHRPPTTADAESNDNFFSPSKEKSFFISTGL